MILKNKLTLIKDIILGIIMFIMFCSVLAYFFYHSVIAFYLMIVFLAVPYYLFYKNHIKEKRRWNNTLEFKELIRIVSSEIQAGISVENSFINAIPEMRRLFGNSAVTTECELIARGVTNNEPIEKLLMEMSTRLGIEEIIDFAEIFTIAKRSGGNLRKIIEDTTNSIDARIEMKREYRIIIASKQMEHRIMCAVPFGIVGYIGISSQGYFDIFYQGSAGRITMTIILVAYIGAFIWGEKIINMRV